MRRFRGTTLRLVGRPLGEGVLPRQGRVNIAVIWVRAEESSAWPYLVSAFDSMSAEDYSPALVFAQSAVEISMMPVIQRRFRRHASGSAVRDLMGGKLTYAHALKVVLPYFCGELGLAKMPQDVLLALDCLRKRRNEIIHEGTKSDAISRQEAVAGMAAAALGFEYMRFVEPLLA